MRNGAQATMDKWSAALVHTTMVTRQHAVVVLIAVVGLIAIFTYLLKTERRSTNLSIDSSTDALRLVQSARNHARDGFVLLTLANDAHLSFVQMRVSM